MGGRPDSLEGARESVNATGGPEAPDSARDPGVVRAPAGLDAEAYEVLARALRGSDVAARTAEAAVELSVSKLGAVHAVVLVRESEAADFVAAAAAGLDLVENRADLLRLAREMAGWVERTRKPLTVRRPEIDARFSEAPATPGPVRSYPINGAGVITGTLTLFDASPEHPFSEVDRHREILLLAAVTASARRETRAQDRLRRVRRELEESERRRLQAERQAASAELAGDMAREIQVPLTGLRERVTALAEGLLEDDPRRAELQVLSDEAARMERVMADLLDVVQSAEPQLRSDDLNRILAECLSLVDHEIQFRQLRVTRRLAANLPPLLVDADLMRRLFLNMLHGAMENASEGGRIKVESKRRGDSLEVILAADGTRDVGRVLDEMWKPFETGSGEAGGPSTGAVRRILREHRGLLQVTSNRDWPLIFSLRIPIPGNQDRRRPGRDRRAGGERRRA
jgi:signal transduction histidine kinase